MIWQELAPYAEAWVIAVAVAVILLALAIGGLVADWLFGGAR